MSEVQQRDSVLRDLFAVMTVSEVMRRYGKAHSTIQYRLDTGALDWRKEGGTILITTDSLIKLWGKPAPPDMSSVQLSLPIW